MLGDAEKAQRGVIAPGPIGRDSRSPPYWVSCSEGKKGGQGQNKGGNQEVEACGGEEQKKVVGVPEVTLGQGFGWGHYPFEEHWGFTGLRV